MQLTYLYYYKLHYVNMAIYVNVVYFLNISFINEGNIY